MRTTKARKMAALKENMALAPIEDVKLEENIGFSVEIPLQMLFDQFTTFISKNDFKDIA